MRAVAVSVALVFAIVSVMGLASLPATGLTASPASHVVLQQFDEVEAALAAMPLSKGDARALDAKLDAARTAAIGGRPVTSVHVLDALQTRLAALGAPPLVTDEVEILRSMILFESLFGPIPDVTFQPPPFPIHILLLDWFLTDVTLPSARGMADSCIAAAFPLPTAASLAFSPSPSPMQEGDPEQKAMEQQVKKAYIDFGKKVLNEVKEAVVGSGEKTDGQSGGDATKGEKEKANVTVRPRCEVDNAAIANASKDDGVTVDTVLAATKSVGVEVSRTFETDLGVSVRVRGTVDILDPFGSRDWRFGAGVDVIGDRFGASMGGTWDRQTGATVTFGLTFDW